MSSTSPEKAPPGTLFWIRSKAWRLEGWRDQEKHRPGLLVLSRYPSLRIAPCSTKFEYLGDYDQREVFIFDSGDVDWDERLGSETAGYAVLSMMPLKFDLGYCGAPMGLLTDAALTRLKQAYREFVQWQKDT